MIKVVVIFDDNKENNGSDMIINTGNSDYSN